ncbi:MAG: molybdate ABC transporter substrate-binding protein [Rhizobiales bacterium]|nr:molybdate ABC transporter substrate-binding protein [Hyphomicrobiales bacterium]
MSLGPGVIVVGLARLLRAGFSAGLLFAASLLSYPVAGDEKPLLVFAAVSLQDALEPIAADFTRKTGQKTSFSFAGSGTLARQIAAGAPADLFIAADLDWVAWLQIQNLTLPETQRIIARNELVLAAPASGPASLAGQSADLGPDAVVAALKNFLATDKARLAVADPENVPAGRYARMALKALEAEIGPYAAYEKRFAIAANVRLATLLVATGEVPLGIIYRSDAIVEPRIKVVGLFNPESHADIVYPAVSTLQGAKRAHAFLDFLGEEAALMHIEAAGLLRPEKGR